MFIRICIAIALTLATGLAYGQSVTLDVSYPVPFWVVLIVAGVAVYAVVALMRKASRHPESFRRHFEAPADRLATALQAANWTGAEIDAVLQRFVDKDLTAKVGGLYTGLTPDQQKLVEAIAAAVKGGGSGPTPPPPA